MKYTSTYEELMEFLDGEFKVYMEEKKPSKDEEKKILSCYEQEKAFVKKQIEKYPDTLKQLCVLAVIGEKAVEEDCIARNPVTQCPLIMFLLKVASYDPMDEYDGAKTYLYPGSSITTGELYICEDFFDVLKDELEKFFAKTGHFIIWIRDKLIEDVMEYEEFMSGFFVMTYENYAKIPKDILKELDEDYEYVLSDDSQELTELGDEFILHCWNLEAYGLNVDVNEALHKYILREMKREEAVKYMATAMIDAWYVDESLYFKEMEKIGANIYSRDDLYERLLSIPIESERALYWTELIRKGRFKRMVNAEKLSEDELDEIYQLLGTELTQLYMTVDYLPSKWSVLEKFFWLTRVSKWE